MRRQFVLSSILAVSLAVTMAGEALGDAVPGYDVVKREGDKVVLEGDFPGKMEVVGELPPTRYGLPEAELRITPSILPAGLPGREIKFTVELDQAAPNASLFVTLPSEWVERSPISGLRFAKPAELVDDSGGEADLARSGRTVELAFENAESRDRASFVVENIGMTAGTYHLPLTWELPDGTRLPAGSAEIRIQVLEREAPEDDLLTRLAEAGRLTSGGVERNVSSDSPTQSETFVAVTPNNRSRVVVGSNGDDAMAAWISNDGGSSWQKQVPSSTLDAPGGTETANICCDPMFAADDDGNIWFGGLSRDNGAGGPSRIFVNRFAAGSSSLNSVSTGLPLGGGTDPPPAAEQDKPLMTIDNSPTSPNYGRLYVVWDAPVSGAVRIVMSQCDTVQFGATPASCDDAGNWSSPAIVSDNPVTGDFIYPDVAVGPNGVVYVTYWDYSANNRITGVPCNDAALDCTASSNWVDDETIAVLDTSDGTPVPFACPIVAQPGGRAAPSPSVEVDRSGGPSNNRVYVTWSDLRDSGSTQCTGRFSSPTTTHDTWDSFVTSAVATSPYTASQNFPGGAASSTTVGTRLITDGESGGANPADDWFPWIGIDQSTGQPWVDFYSTRDDSSRRTTHFYVRTVTPSGGGHSLGGLTRVSGAASDYSSEPCCDFGNQYGDYTGIDAAQGVAYPVWSDKRGGSSAPGEVYSFGAPPVSAPPATPAIDTTPPSLTVSLGKKTSLTQLVKGLRFNVTTDEAADISAKLKTKKSVAKKLKIAAAKTVKIGSASESVAANDKTSMRVKLTSKARRRLRALTRRRIKPFKVTLTVTATDSAGNESSTEKSSRVE